MNFVRWLLITTFLAVLYIQNAIAATDWSKAGISELRHAAKQGSASAQYVLGTDYEHGRGVPKDYTKAVYWWRKSAKQGNAAALNDIGYAYDSGEGVPVNHSKAIEWYRRAAKLGLAMAQHNLAIDYETGTGIPTDYSKAVYWNRKAANQGYADAQDDLGIAYFYGEGVPQDYAKAVKWFRKSANQGNAIAQFSLGTAYIHGQGVPQDYTKAVYWWRKSAEQGYADAQGDLGIAYAQGEGVPQDYAKAVQWFRKSANQSNKIAENALVETEKLLQIEMHENARDPLYILKSRTYWVDMESSGLCVPAAAFIIKNIGNAPLGTFILRATFLNPSKKRIFATVTKWVNGSGSLPVGYTLATMVHGDVGFVYALGNCLKRAPNLRVNVTAQIFKTGQEFNIFNESFIGKRSNIYSYISGQPLDEWVRNTFKNN